MDIAWSYYLQKKVEKQSKNKHKNNYENKYKELIVKEKENKFTPVNYCTGCGQQLYFCIKIYFYGR
jgi:hypothetical protein